MRGPTVTFERLERSTTPLPPPPSPSPPNIIASQRNYHGALGIENQSSIFPSAIIFCISLRKYFLLIFIFSVKATRFPETDKKNSKCSWSRNFFSVTCTNFFFSACRHREMKRIEWKVHRPFSHRR